MSLVSDLTESVSSHSNKRREDDVYGNQIYTDYKPNQPAFSDPNSLQKSS